MKTRPDSGAVASTINPSEFTRLLKPALLTARTMITYATPFSNSKPASNRSTYAQSLKYSASEDLMKEGAMLFTSS